MINGLINKIFFTKRWRGITDRMAVQQLKYGSARGKKAAGEF